MSGYDRRIIDVQVYADNGTTTVAGVVISKSGIAQVDLPVVDFDTYWVVERIAIESDSATTPTCFLFRVVANTEFLADFSQSGNNDVSEYPFGLVVQQGEKLRFRWNGTTAPQSADPTGKANLTRLPAASCRAHIQYRIEFVSYGRSD